MNLLLSYPRSGNHLVRFFIELMSETPTLGVKENAKDIPLYLNTYTQDVPFNISPEKQYDETECFRKAHIAPPKAAPINKLILILRNPRECLIRQNGFYSWNQNYNWHSYEAYFRIIDYYLESNAKKIIFYYEDILTDPLTFISQLYHFLEINNPQKLSYCLENAAQLYEICAQGKGRSWEEMRSFGNLNFYYPRIRILIKDKFDAFLTEQCSKDKFAFVGEKYNIPRT